MDKTTEELFERMAEIKLVSKKLEEEYKKLEEEAWKKLKTSSFTNEQGTFTKNIRKYYGIKDKNALVKKMTFKTYKEFSTISKTGIISALGEKGFEKLKEEKIVKVNSTAKFFTFKQKKSNALAA